MEPKAPNVRRSGMKDYFVGDVIDIDPIRTDPNFAIAVLGQQVYDCLRNTVREYKGIVRIKSVDRTKRTITVEWEEN